MREACGIDCTYARYKMWAWFVIEFDVNSGWYAGLRMKNNGGIIVITRAENKSNQVCSVPNVTPMVAD